MALGEATGPTRQDVPGESQENHGGPPSGPPGPPPSGASDQFSSQTLSSLLSAQEQANGGSEDLANKLIGQADTDGDGLLSLTEIQSTLGGGDSADTTGLTAALGALDTNGDGKLSSAELAAALEKGKAQHAHHGHHGHHAKAAESQPETRTTAEDTDPSQATEAA